MAAAVVFRRITLLLGLPETDDVNGLPPYNQVLEKEIKNSR